MYSPQCLSIYHFRTRLSAWFQLLLPFVCCIGECLAISVNHLGVTMTSHSKTLLAGWTITWMTCQWTRMLASVWPFFRTHFFAGDAFRTRLKCRVQAEVNRESTVFVTSVWLETPVTKWQGRLHRWFWHLRVRLHKWPQQKRRAVEQGKIWD